MNTNTTNTETRNPEDIVLEEELIQNTYRNMIHIVNNNTSLGRERNLVFKALTALLSDDIEMYKESLWNMNLDECAAYLITKTKLAEYIRRGK